MQHRLATLALTELGEVIRDAVQGRAGRDALAGMLTAVRAYVSVHPGRYAATTGAEFTGSDDPLLAARSRVIDSIAAVLRGYGIGKEEMNHAIRTIRSTMHGFAILEASRGFQWEADPDESFEWMIRLIDRGLRPALGLRGVLGGSGGVAAAGGGSPYQDAPVPAARGATLRVLQLSPPIEPRVTLR